jgi:AP-4 complex subunit epsilon-1
MLVNQLQRDMASSNQLECWAALTALTKLVTKDMVPAVMSDVLRLLSHKVNLRTKCPPVFLSFSHISIIFFLQVELVRKKAVMALHRFHQLSPGSVEGLGEKARRCLCDRDPAVMGASVCLLHELAVANPNKFKDLIPRFSTYVCVISSYCHSTSLKGEGGGCNSFLVTTL